MRCQIISGFHPAAYGKYAKNFLTTFDTFWPGDARLAVYVEEPVEFRSPKVEFRSLWDCPGQKIFIDRFKDVPAANGYISPLGGHDRRFICVRFSRQGFIPEHAMERLNDGDIMAWFDADVMTYRHIPDQFIENMLDGADIVTSGDRTAWRKSTDIGFWAARVSPKTRDFVARFAGLYRSGEVFDLYEWHSGFVFDFVVKEMRKSKGLRVKPLVAPIRKCHIWFSSVLGEFTDHLAGVERKNQGHSKERAPQTL